MNAQKQEKGFTIIEVVLVLAIAALIFLMIFIALPALQRGQRDTARKNDVGIIASALNTYKSTHRGALPAENGDGAFRGDYLKGSTGLSQIAVDSVTIESGGGNGPSSSTYDTAIIYVSAKCSDTNTADGNGTDRQAAVITTLETGGRYCQGV